MQTQKQRGWMHSRFISHVDFLVVSVCVSVNCLFSLIWVAWRSLGIILFFFFATL